MIQCRHCKETKEATEFYSGSKTCKPCYLARQKQREVMNRAWMQAYKLRHGCANCGYNEHPAALQFDHIDRSSKEANVGQMSSYSRERMKKEIAKCRVLCANCHSIHTHYPNHINIDKDETE